MYHGSDAVFYFSPGKPIHTLPARSFRTGLFGTTLEKALQTLIERHPDVIPGHQLDPGAADPPRFLLLRRETAVGDWSLDHLLVDQRGVPTLLEAKLLENPDSRRAVIGQIIEYAANASPTWGNGRLRALASEYWAKSGRDVDSIVRDRFGDIDLGAFWDLVDTNVKQAKLRLIVAADELRPDVRRMIEFLNSQLRTVQVFGLELRCFANDDTSGVIVPFVVGQTAIVADEKERPTAGRLWAADELHEFYDKHDGCDAAKRLLNWATRAGCAIFGTSQSPVFGLRGTAGARVMTVYSDGVYVVLRESAYGNSAATRDSFVAGLKALRLLPADLGPHTIKDGRNLVRSLSGLTDAEQAAFMSLLSSYCASGDSGDFTAVHSSHLVDESGA